MSQPAAPPGGPVVASGVVVPALRLRGELRLPGDKSISHRALMLALLARGESRILGAGDGADIRSTAGIVAALGATVERLGNEGDRVDYRVESPGAVQLRTPSETLDCGNSGTSLRLFAGILAGLPMTATLDGDDSLRRRPVARIIEPLRAMGATLTARDNDSFPPLTVTGRGTPATIDWTTPVPSAQVKSAILLAGLRADGITRVRELVATRDHTERMLRVRGVAVRSASDGGGGAVIEIEGGSAVAAMNERVPGDPSAAAFWLVAAAIHPDARITLHGVGANPTRRGLLELLARMGAMIDERPLETLEGRPDGEGEPVSDFTVGSAELRGIDVSPSDVAGAIDEIPILCLAATQARGRTTIRGAGELRHKESDRLVGIVAGLTALGASVRAEDDGLMIDGPTPLTGAETASLGDHRLAMTFAIAGLIASGRTTIDQPMSASVSYPAFFHDLERIRA